MRWFAHDLRATKLRKIAPMYLNMLCAASGGKTNGDGSISSPPQGYTNVFPSFPSKEVRCFSQPHYKNNNHFFLTPFLCVFFGFLATPNPGPFWWLPLIHYELGQPRNSQNGGMRFPARFFRVGSWNFDTWSACVLQVCPKLSLLDYYFFVRNPYICKFWDMIFEENVKNKNKNPKGSVLGTLGIHMRITCQNCNFQLEKPRGKSHFSIWAQTLGAGRSGIYRKMRGFTDRTVVHVLYSVLHCSVAAAERLAAVLCSSFVSVSGASASASASVSVRFWFRRKKKSFIPFFSLL